MSASVLEHLERGFALLEKEGKGDRAAFARFRKLGLPTPHDEEWRFTPIAPIAKSAYPLARPGGGVATKADVERLGLAGPRRALLVFEDGFYRADLSTESRDCTVGSLAANKPKLPKWEGEEGALQALHAAFYEDGPHVRVQKGSGAPDPIHIVHLSTGCSSFPRALIHVEEGAEAMIAEVFASLGSGGHFTNGLTDVIVARNASLEYARLQLENEKAVTLSHLRVRQARDSRFTQHQITLGGALVRNEITASLDDENVLCTLNGLFLTHGTQHVENHTELLHRMPHGESHELYKGILDDRSSGVFSGKIHVFEGAQKTDAKQSSSNLLLTDTAVVDAKPQLEIYADDVKCTHGATVGQLDPNALFYLQARGIPAAQARQMLIGAFAADVTLRIGIASARERIEALLQQRLPGGA